MASIVISTSLCYPEDSSKIESFGVHIAENIPILSDPDNAGAEKCLLQLESHFQVLC